MISNQTPPVILMCFHEFTILKPEQILVHKKKKK